MTANRAMSAPKPHSGSPQGSRLGFFGVLGSGSLGNDGSLDAMIAYLRDRHPDASLDFLVMGPDRLRELYGAPTTHLQWFEATRDRLPGVPTPLLKILGRFLDPFRTMAWARQQDVVIVPGMGVLESTIPMRPWGFPWGLFWLCAGARLTGRRVALVCVGADVIRRPLTRWLITRAARMAHYRSYRDQHSRESMRRMGVDVRADEVFPDLAFLHPVPSAVPDGSGTVGLGVMDYVGNNDERDRADELHRAYVDAMARFAVWLVGRGRPVRLFTCDPVDATVVDAVVAEVRRRHPDVADALVTAEPAGTLQELMRQMAGTDLVVATRYHNVVAAVQMSIPTVSVGYSPKHDELMGRMGLGDYCQHAGSVDVERLIAQVAGLEEDRDRLVATMRDRNVDNLAGVRDQFAQLSTAVLRMSPDGP